MEIVMLNELTFRSKIGVVVNSLTFSLFILVVSFQLKGLGYTHVASLTGWLVFAGGVGEVIGTFSANFPHDARKSPYVTGILMFIISQVMFMEAPYYWVMCLVRCLHGIGSAARMVIGPTTVCDQSPSQVFGSRSLTSVFCLFLVISPGQLGIALSGAPIGLLLGSPIGGPLYSHFGFRVPFVFGVIAVLPVLALLLLIVQVRYVPRPPSFVDRQDELPLESERRGSNDMGTTVISDQVQNKISFVKVLRLMLQSPRAVAALCIVFIHGMFDVLMQPVMPSHLNSTWGLNVSQVGLVFLASTIPVVPAVLFSVVVITSTLAMACVFLRIGVLAPILAEFASISRSIDGVGYAHVYEALYLAFGVGTTNSFGHLSHAESC
ncbi:major facilitator superfamily domain-containing protein [Armillaria borealis]|uniref:Major facilitator superfamily domain-containing protein n=1 Tax=Armillaria borealis TaxID=47425 RepID=A0AA39J7C4_9AGAR|nr:major facilitator superfamily domain-containing protein [Armillaria borealis]